MAKVLNIRAIKGMLKSNNGVVKLKTFLKTGEVIPTAEAIAEVLNAIEDDITRGYWDSMGELLVDFLNKTDYTKDGGEVVKKALVDCLDALEEKPRYYCPKDFKSRYALYAWFGGDFPYEDETIRMHIGTRNDNNIGSSVCLYTLKQKEKFIEFLKKTKDCNAFKKGNPYDENIHMKDFIAEINRDRHFWGGGFYTEGFSNGVALKVFKERILAGEADEMTDITKLTYVHYACATAISSAICLGNETRYDKEEVIGDIYADLKAIIDYFPNEVFTMPPSEAYARFRMAEIAIVSSKKSLGIYEKREIIHKWNSIGTRVESQLGDNSLSGFYGNSALFTPFSKNAVEKKMFGPGIDLGRYFDLSALEEICLTKAENINKAFLTKALTANTLLAVVCNNRLVDCNGKLEDFCSSTTLYLHAGIAHMKDEEWELVKDFYDLSRPRKYLRKTDFCEVTYRRLIDAYKESKLESKEFVETLNAKTHYLANGGEIFRLTIKAIEEIERMVSEVNEDIRVATLRLLVEAKASLLTANNLKDKSPTFVVEILKDSSVLKALGERGSSSIRNLCPRLYGPSCSADAANLPDLDSILKLL